MAADCNNISDPFYRKKRANVFIDSLLILYFIMFIKSFIILNKILGNL